MFKRTVFITSRILGGIFSFSTSHERDRLHIDCAFNMHTMYTKYRPSTAAADEVVDANDGRTRGRRGTKYLLYSRRVRPGVCACVCNN